MDAIKKLQIENKIASGFGHTIDLSQEKMDHQDYEWLAKIIQTNSNVAEIKLPVITKQLAAFVLDLLDRATFQNSVLKRINIAFDNGISKEILAKRRNILLRLERNQKKIFGIHGGGAIGLGLMADIISKSHSNYQVYATSNNSLNQNLINAVNRLWISHPNNTTTMISDIHMLSRNSEDVSRLYEQSSIVAICLTSAVLPTVAKDIARGLLKRYEMDRSGIQILVLMNIPNCDQFVRDKVYEQLLSLTQNEENANNVIFRTRFVPTVIDRIVTPIPQNVILDSLRKQLNSHSKVELKKMLGEENVERILLDEKLLKKAVIVFNLQFELFKAENKFSMHVPHDFVCANHFPAMTITKDLKLLETVKNKFINGPHAVLAWSGALLGCKTIAEAIRRPELRQFISEMMSQEIAPILRTEYPQISQTELDDLKQSFFERCEDSIDDPVTRVGRDPMRKLDQGGRVRGAIELARKHCLAVSTARLEQGVAAGFLYAIKGFDSQNAGCQQLEQIYNLNQKSYAALLSYSGPAPSGEFKGFHPIEDRKTISNIVAGMNRFESKLVVSSFGKFKSSSALVLSNVSSSIPKMLHSISDYATSVLSHVSHDQKLFNRLNKRVVNQNLCITQSQDGLFKTSHHQHQQKKAHDDTVKKGIYKNGI